MTPEVPIAAPRSSANTTPGRWGAAYIVLGSILLGGCSSVPLKEGGSLQSYASLGPQKGTLSKSRTFVDARGLTSVRTVSIAPTRFSATALRTQLSEAEKKLVANALDRALCVALSDRFQITESGQPADLVVRTVITDIVPTGKTAAGVATAVSLGSSVALPVSLPRLPIGLGGLAVEGEAVDGFGIQRAAIVWARGANSIQNKPRVSQVGDAYELAGRFGSEFSRMLVKGKDTGGLDLSLPSSQRMRSWLGGKPKFRACERFGRAPGLAGAIAGNFGAPPQWTEKRPPQQ